MATQATMTTISAMLKDQYVGPIESAINTEHPVLKLLGEDNRKPSGNGIFFPVQVQYNTSARAMSEEDDIPESSRSVEVQATVAPVQLAGRLKITQKVLDNAADDKDAFVEDLTYEMDRLKDGLLNDFDRQLAGRYAYDDSGTPTAYRTGVIAALTATCANAATTATVNSTQGFNEGDLIAIGTNSDLSGSSDSACGTAQVTGITSETVLAITALAGPGGGSCSSGDYITKGTGSTAKNAYNKELLGIDFGVDNSALSFEGIDASSYPRWAAVVGSNGGVARPLAVEDMQAVLTQGQVKSGRMPDTIFCHPTHRDQYVQLIDPQVRYEPRKPDGGYSGDVTFAHGQRVFTFVTSRYAKLGVVYFLDTKSVKKNFSKKPGWMDRDGAVLSRIQNKTAYEATMTTSVALCWRNRVTHAKLTDLSY